MDTNISNSGGNFGKRIAQWGAALVLFAAGVFPSGAGGATLAVSSPSFRLRTAIENPIDASVGETQTIAYSTRWDSPEAGGVQVSSRAPSGSSTTLFSSSSAAEGMVAWTPLVSGYHVLTHATTIKRTVTFRVGTLVDIVYDAEGGTPATQTQRHIADAPFGEFPPSPNREGYSFAGWWTAKTGGTKVETNTIVAGAATLHARWTANTYTVTLDQQQGTGGTASVTASFGTAMPKISVPTRAGYAFGGYWSAANGGGTQYYTATGASARAWDMPSATILYAKWTPQSYVVTLDAQGGTGGTASVTATYGSVLPSITIPKRPGYVFAGYWSAPGGTGTQYYTENGTGAQNWDKVTATPLFAHWTDPVFHVDATVGDDNNDGFTWQTAKASIQAAINEARDGGRILVNDGVYGPVSTVHWESSGGEWYAVAKVLEIVSVNGAEKTVIDASLTLDDRCAFLGQADYFTGKPTGPQAILDGFTLRGAQSGEDSSPIGAGAYGGILRRCIVTGNQTRASGAGVACATCEGCTISGNKTTLHGGGVFYCTLTECTVEDNEAGENGGGAFGGKLERCVVRRNSAGRYGGGQSGGTAVDCLFAGNDATLGGGGVNASHLSRCTVTGNQTDGTGGGAIRAVFHSSIVWGNTAIQDDNYNTSLGAYNDTSPLLPGRGNISADPLFRDSTTGDYRLNTGSPCIDAGFGPTDTERKDLGGNQRWQGAHMDMGAYETVGSPAPTFTIADLWVDAANGRDAASGTSREAPLATIQAAVEKASDGATIHVLPGTYEPFSMDSRSLTVQSTDGAEKTIVDGKGIAPCAWLGSDSESVLVGLTLCNGYAFELGGGVVGGTLRECIIRDNTADDEGGGGACQARLDRCILMGNSTRNGSGGGALACDLSNCLVYSNSAVYGGGICGNFHSVWNCTVTDNSATEVGGGIESAFVKNSIVWNNSAPLGPDIWNSDEWHICASVVDAGCGSIMEDPLFMDAAAGDFRLRPDSPCVNAGANDYVQGEKDFAGNVRIYGSSVDMGAYELLAGLIVQLEPQMSVGRRSCVLQIGAAKGCQYEVQWTADLREKWTTVKSWTADKDGEIEVEAIPLTDGNIGFFRLVMPE